MTWSDPIPNNPNCIWLEQITVHETGHAFGLHHGTAHDTITSGGGLYTERLCGPTKYDVAAVTANYQSRNP